MGAWRSSFCPARLGQCCSPPPLNSLPATLRRGRRPRAQLFIAAAQTPLAALVRMGTTAFLLGLAYCLCNRVLAVTSTSLSPAHHGTHGSPFVRAGSIARALASHRLASLCASRTSVAFGGPRRPPLAIDQAISKLH